jgi:hypothetical protein
MTSEAGALRSAPASGQEVLAYLEGGIDSFARDRPDSPFQEGYFEALKNVREFIVNGLDAGKAP